jgi:RimJ/RimL family protein N-acetyltransferase
MAFVPGKVIRQFSLQERKVVFRYPRKSDTDNFFRHVNSLVKEKACILVQKKKTRAEEKKWLEDNLKNMKNGNAVQVCVEVSGKFAGSSQITRRKGDASRHVVTLGIGLGNDFRNMGIGTELMKTMEQLARREMKAKIIKLSYFEENQRSKHVYEKLGYKEVGRIPKGVNHYGKYMDEVLMIKVLK